MRQKCYCWREKMKTMINDEGIVIMKINERENDKKYH